MDWGDSLEAMDARSMQRVETTLKANITAGMLADPAATTMTSYPMCKTSVDTGQDEMWGAIVDEDPLEKEDALVYTAGARLTIQRVVPDRAYTWDTANHRWIGCGADDPVVNTSVRDAGDGPGAYGAEVTISGNVTYGYVLGHRRSAQGRRVPAYLQPRRTGGRLPRLGHKPGQRDHPAEHRDRSAA